MRQTAGTEALTHQNADVFLTAQASGDTASNIYQDQPTFPATSITVCLSVYSPHVPLLDGLFRFSQNVRCQILVVNWGYWFNFVRCKFNYDEKIWDGNVWAGWKSELQFKSKKEESLKKPSETDFCKEDTRIEMAAIKNSGSDIRENKKKCLQIKRPDFFLWLGLTVLYLSDCFCGGV